MTHSSPHWISRNASPHGDQLVTKWLFGMVLLVAIMVVIGGVTRLTGSGLSMVEWRPLIGTLPPLNAAEWDRVYQLYQASPEYQQLNYGMSLAAFKNIFFWEYFHRLWGRLLGPCLWPAIFDFCDYRARAARVWMAAYLLLCLGGFRALLAGGWSNLALPNRPAFRNIGLHRILLLRW
jgi:cytochrome c oxidase assembly protein subunit 15